MDGQVMRRPRVAVLARLAGMLLLVFIVATIAVPVSRSWVVGHVRGEPFFRGRPASSWEDRLHRDPDKAVRENASVALRHPDAVPVLQTMLRPGQGVLLFWEAADILIAIGPPAVPALVDALGGDNHFMARDALSRMGRSAVPALIQALDNPDANVRARAAETLGYLQGDARDAVPALMERLDDKKESVRDEAASTLDAIGPEAVPGLLAALGGEREMVRCGAARALRLTSHPDAPQLLLKCLNDPSPFVRAAAARSLGGKGPRDPATVPALVAALKDDDALVRRAAGRALNLVRSPGWDEQLQPENPATYVVEIDPENGRLFDLDSFRTEVRTEYDAEALIARERKVVAPREVRFVILCPAARFRRPSAEQRETYERWFHDIPHVFQ